MKIKLNIDNKSIRILLGVVISLGIAILIYLCLVKFFIDSYVIYNERFDERSITVNEFCKSFNNTNKTKPIIILIGQSTTVYSLNASQMETELDNKYDIYNLGIGGADNVFISLFDECINNINPDIIIYPFASSVISGYGSNYDDLYVISKKYIRLDKADYRYNLLTNNAKSILEYNYFDVQYYKRKYLIFYSFDIIRSIYMKYPNDNYRGMKDPHPLRMIKGNTSIEEFRNMRNTTLKEYINYSNTFNDKENTQLFALNYILINLSDNTKVYLVQFPQHPLILEVTNKEVEIKFDEYFTDLCLRHNCTYESMKYLFKNLSDEKNFLDTAHTTIDGMNIFTSEISSMIKGDYER